MAVAAVLRNEQPLCEQSGDARSLYCTARMRKIDERVLQHVLQSVVCGANLIALTSSTRERSAQIHHGSLGEGRGPSGVELRVDARPFGEVRRATSQACFLDVNSLRRSAIYIQLWSWGRRLLPGCPDKYEKRLAGKSVLPQQKKGLGLG